MFLPTFFMMVKLYLVCNYHDASWGSRAKPAKKKASFKRKYILSTLVILASWLLVNGFLVYLI